MPTLRKRGRIWYSDLWIGGRRIRKPLSHDRRIADARLAELIKDRDGTKYGHAAQDLNWTTFRAKYMEYSRGAKKGSTPARDEAALVALERFERLKKLTDITPERLERWRAARKAAGKGEATIARDLNAVKAMLRKATAWGYIGARDWGSVKSPKSTRRRLVFFTVSELRILLKKCRTMYPDKSSNDVPHDWVTVAMLGARAGLRRGEMLHLAWEDVDLGRKMLSVTPKACPCASCAPGGLWEAKDYEQRHLPMPDDLVRHLRGLARPTAWVLGHRPAAGTVTNYFRRIVKKARLKGCVHTLRHTYASHLAQAGVPLYTISKLLGHSNMAQTIVYAHLCPDTYDAAILKLPRL